MNAWPRACALLAIPALAVGVTGLGSDALAWQAHGWLARPWTLWTAAWVNPSAASLVGSVLVMALFAVLGAWLRLGRAAASALSVAWPLSALGLLLWPGVHIYSGLAGPIHAAAMVVWAHLAFRPDAKALSFAIFAGMGLKLLAERAWVIPAAFDLGWGVNVVPAAHLTGAAAGAIAGLLSVGLARWRGQS